MAVAEPNNKGGLSQNQFTDVSNNPNALFINYLSNKGLIGGFPDGTYKPQNGLTRAEAAALLVRIAGLKTNQNASSFKDVPQNHWAKGAIEAAASAGLVKGYGDGTYRPNEKLSRAEGVALFIRLSKQPDPGTALPSLQDVSQQNWAARPIAIALAADMVGLSQDKRNFFPQAPFTRGDLARLVGILITRDPGLYKTDLTGKLTVSSGTAIVTRADTQNTYSSQATAEIKAGDKIETGQGCTAEMVFPDGSAILLEKNTSLVVKESRGRSYIQPNGLPGEEVDWLLLDLKVGTIIGALATDYEKPGMQGTHNKYPLLGASDENVVKSIIANELLAKNDQQKLPWWQTSQNSRVRVQVDMPWGVAAVRGTNWQNIVDRSGRSVTAVLTGLVQQTAGNRTVTIAPDQQSEITQAQAAPTVATRCSEQIRQSWVQHAQWLIDRAQEIDQKLEKQLPPPAPAVAQPSQQQQQQQTQQQQAVSLQTVYSALVEANGGDKPAGVTLPSTFTPPQSSSTTTKPPASGGGGGGGGTTGDTQKYNITEILSLNDITVGKGTSLSAIGLPASVSVKMSDNSTRTVNVNWDGGTPVYNGNVAGTYQFTGALELVGGITNPQNLKANVKVVVQAEPVLTVKSATALSDTKVKVIFTDNVEKTYTLSQPLQYGTNWITVTYNSQKYTTSVVCNQEDSNPPAIPAAYYGTIMVNGGAPSGTTVEARVGGACIAYIVTEEDNKFGTSGKLIVQGVADGTVIEFWVKLPDAASFVKGGSCQFKSSDVKEIDLRI